MEKIHSEIDLKRKICDFINDWLKNSNHSARYLAKELGVTETSVRRWRSYVCAPELSQLPKLCEIMATSITELFGFDISTQLSLDDARILNHYHNDVQFKSFIDK